MMDAYCGGHVPPALYARLELYKIMSDLLWALWGMVEHANGNSAEDFRAYALERLEHCKTRMRDANLVEYLAVVHAGRQPYVPRTHFRIDGQRKAPARHDLRGQAYPVGSPPSPLPPATSAP